MYIKISYILCKYSSMIKHNCFTAMFQKRSYCMSKLAILTLNEEWHKKQTSKKCKPESIN